MPITTQHALPRRAFLRPIWVAPTLSRLGALQPVLLACAPRFTTLCVGNGMNMLAWTPATLGVGFEPPPPFLQFLQPFAEP